MTWDLRKLHICFLENRCILALTPFLICVSLNGSRRVRTGEDDDENQGDKALDPAVLDHYATRANW